MASTFISTSSSPRSHSSHRRLLRAAAAFFFSALVTLRADHPLEGSWYLTAFEHEVATNPAAFAHAPLPFKRVTITETTPGTLRLELRNASGALLETEERSFTQNGAIYESTRTETEPQGREHQRLAFQVLRDDLALAHDLGAFFALDDRDLYDAFGSAGVLTRNPLPKVNAALWAGPYAGQEWIYTTHYNQESGTWSLAREAGELDFQIDKSGSTYRFTATVVDEAEPYIGTLKPSGTFLTLEENEVGGIRFTAPDASGSILFDRSRYRLLQISSTELVLLGLSGAVARISPTEGNPFPFIAYNTIDFADSSVAYLQSTANFAFEGQAVSLPAPSAETSGIFTAKGLPAGLTLDSVSGALTGFANAKPGNYAITRTAGSFTDIVYLRILPFPDNLLANPDVTTRVSASEYDALLREPGTDLPVGKVELKLSQGGLFTGKLTTGVTRAFVLKSRLAPNADGNEASTSIVLPDASVLNVSIDPEGRIFASLSAGDTTIGVTQPGAYGGRVRVFSATNPAPGGQSSGNTAYTLALSPLGPEGPTGHGWATGTITPGGNLTLKGKLADGHPLTASLRATTGGYLPYLKPYGTGLVNNHLAGRILLTSRPGGGFHQPADTTTDLHWRKPAALGSSDRIAAFGPVALDAALEPWASITTAEQFAELLGISGAALSVSIASEDATNLDPDRALPDTLAFTVTNGRFASSVASPVLDETSPTANTRAWAKVWNLSVNLKAGTFTGQFTVRDVVEAPTSSNPSATKTIVRSVPYTGVFLQGSDNTLPGLGQFVIPDLIKTDPSSVGAITFGPNSD